MSIKTKQFPLKRFPTEILDIILTIACESDLQNAAEGLITTPLLIGAVCKAWRSLVWSNPQAWTTIILHISTMHYEYQLEMLDIWLRRSKNLPLYIYFDADRFFSRVRGTPIEAFRKLAEHSERWAYLDICVFEDRSRFRKLLSSMAGKIPQLQTFNARPYLKPDYGRTETAGIKMLKGANLLTSMSVSILSVDEFVVDWSKITTLTCNDQWVSEAAETMERCPQVTSCSFSGIYWDGDFAEDDGIEFQ